MNNWKKKYEELSEKVRLQKERQAELEPKRQNAWKSDGISTGRKEIAEILLDLLDLRSDYPHRIANLQSVYGWYEAEVSGAGDFVKDLLAAKDAINGQASLKKIRKALRNKEEK